VDDELEPEAMVDDELEPEAMVVDGVSMGEREWRRWYLPSTLCRTLDRKGVSVGCAAHDEPCEVCRRPPPLYIRTGDRGPPTIDRLDALDQNAIKGPLEPLGSIRWRYLTV
jgi:hypothetical protein